VVQQINVEVGGAAEAEELFDPICDLYDAVFSQPPFFWRDDESELHRDRLTGLLKDPTFGIAIAREGEDLVGFAYGFSLAPDTQRWQRLTEAVPPDVAAEWPGRTFLLFDYAVKANHRGRGVGKALHDALLGSRREERATLTVQPTATATKQIYERWGWRQVGQMEGGPTAAAPLFDAYVRDPLDDLKPA